MRTVIVMHREFRRSEGVHALADVLGMSVEFGSFESPAFDRLLLGKEDIETFESFEGLPFGLDDRAALFAWFVAKRDPVELMPLCGPKSLEYAYRAAGMPAHGFFPYYGQVVYRTLSRTGRVSYFRVPMAYRSATTWERATPVLAGAPLTCVVCAGVDGFVWGEWVALAEYLGVPCYQVEEGTRTVDPIEGCVWVSHTETGYSAPFEFVPSAKVVRPHDKLALVERCVQSHPFGDVPGWRTRALSDTRVPVYVPTMSSEELESLIQVYGVAGALQRVKLQDRVTVRLPADLLPLLEV